MKAKTSPYALVQLC